ncbi:unnamed protein product, partial [Tetraodon nigroviridis]
DDWSKEDCLTLLERIRSLLPDGDGMKYKTTESHFDWDKVGFGSFTGDMCRQKWQKVSTEVRKYRTMTELIVDAIEFVKNPYKGKKLKTHPDFPKKPLTPYFRFFMEKRAKYAKIHPEMSNLDLTKILSKKYKELPDKKKVRCHRGTSPTSRNLEVLQALTVASIRSKNTSQSSSERKRSLRRTWLDSSESPLQACSASASLLMLLTCREDHPELIEERKKSELPEKPKTPQQLWYNHEKKAYMKLHPEVSQKELKEVLRRQWSQLSDKRRLKWISKALELQKDYEGSMRAYHEAHPDMNSDDHVRSVLTKAERQLKDKFDGRPTKPPPNGYSLYCAELMVNMKDVPSTERMVLCSKRWKLMTQKEKDMFQKRCEQKKKQYDVDLQRFLESLPEEERERVMAEEKMCGSRVGGGVASSPHRARSPVKVPPQQPPWSWQDQQGCRFSTPDPQEQLVEAEPEHWLPAGVPKERRDGRKSAKLPETPKTAEEMWQHSVIGDYLAKYRSDRRKAQVGMEAAWKSMEKKEKIPWIKKAAEDQKRYERELLEMRTLPAAPSQRKHKFDGEPKKPPVSGYQMFSQELLTNGELNHFSLKERMVEIGKRWHKLSAAQKDKYKKLVEEQQVEYKVELEAWLKALSPQDHAVYKELSSSVRLFVGPASSSSSSSSLSSSSSPPQKRRSTTKVRSSPDVKVRVTAKAKAPGSRAATPAVGVAKRVMAYRAKVAAESPSVCVCVCAGHPFPQSGPSGCVSVFQQDMSDSDEEEEKSESSDSDEDETSGSTDSEDDDEDDENEDDDDDDEDQSSSDESSDSDSD